MTGCNLKFGLIIKRILAIVHSFFLLNNIMQHYLISYSYVKNVLNKIFFLRTTVQRLVSKKKLNGLN